MNHQNYKREIARLTSQLDHLETELSYLNHSLIEVGFPEGIKTLKASIKELLEETAKEFSYAKKKQE